MKKSSEVFIKTRSTPASLSFKGQTTKHINSMTTVIKQSLIYSVYQHQNVPFYHRRVFITIKVCSGPKPCIRSHG